MSEPRWCNETTTDFNEYEYVTECRHLEGVKSDKSGFMAVD